MSMKKSFLFMMMFCLCCVALAQAQTAANTPATVYKNPYFIAPYSIDPSFSVSINYDFSIYDQIPDYLNRIEPCKEDINCVVRNLEDFEKEKPGWKWLSSYGGNIIGADKDISKQGLWEAFCEYPEEHAVNSIAEAVDSCIGTTDTNCVCSYSLPVGEREGVDKAEFDSVFPSAKSNVFTNFFGAVYDYKKRYEEEWPERTLIFILSGKDLRVSLFPKGKSEPQIVHNVNAFGLGGDFASAPSVVNVKFKDESAFSYRFNRKDRFWEYKKNIVSWPNVKEMEAGSFQSIIAKTLERKDELGGYAFLKMYKDKKLEPKLESITGLPGEGLGANIKSQDRLKYLYDNEINQFDVHKDKDNNIVIYPGGAAPMQRQCKQYNKMMKFCIIQNKSVVAYNKDTNQLELQQLVMRFAYMFKGEVSSISNFEVYDLPLSSNKSVLFWDLLEGNVMNYNIYYSESAGIAATFRDRAPKSFDSSSIEGLKMLSVNVATAEDKDIEVSSILEPRCAVKGTNCEISYGISSSLSPEDIISEDGTFSTLLKDKKLYYSILENKYFYIIPELNNGQYYVFAITATDSTGAESPAFTLTDAEHNEAPNDDVPPALAVIRFVAIEGENVAFTIDPVTTNIDGTQLQSDYSITYKIYCFNDGEVDFDNSMKDGLYAEGISQLNDGSVTFSRPASDFTEVECGFIESPHQARFAVIGIKTVVMEDIEYKGILSEESLSSVLTLPEI